MLDPDDTSDNHPSNLNVRAQFEQAKLYERLRPSIDGQGLCFRCTNSLITKRRTKNEPTIFCHEARQPMPPDIEQCNKFQPRGQLNIWDLAQLCRIIEVQPASERGGYR
jgi:hypothetical protein